MTMILCVDMTALKEDPEVQRDVDLEDILNNHTKFFDDEETAYKEKYAPLKFCISIRSTYSNKVLEKEDTIFDSKEYYTTIKVTQPFNHKGYDLLMFITSIGIMSNIFYGAGFDDLMFNHSQFQPIGILNLGASPLVDPIILTHVILTDDAVEEFTKYLMPSRQFVPISEMDVLHNPLANTLIEIKEEENDATSDNN